DVPVTNCYAVKCDKCGKTTWKGCGAHIESVSLGYYYSFRSGKRWLPSFSRSFMSPPPEIYFFY
ncbi:hypothetical protein B0F90DRAFT_1697053, partial [Multifurca ochricompacta]